MMPQLWQACFDEAQPASSMGRAMQHMAGCVERSRQPEGSASGVVAESLGLHARLVAGGAVLGIPLVQLLRDGRMQPRGCAQRLT